MSEGGSRFTAWFSHAERTALEVEAIRRGVTLNFIVRRAVRKELGKDALKQAAQDVMDVTSNK